MKINVPKNSSLPDEKDLKGPYAKFGFKDTDVDNVRFQREESFAEASSKAGASEAQQPLSASTAANEALADMPPRLPPAAASKSKRRSDSKESSAPASKR